MHPFYPTTATDTATSLDAALAYVDEAAHLLRPVGPYQPDARPVAALIAHATGLALDLPNASLLSCLADFGVGPGEAQTAARAIVGLAQAVVLHCQGARHD